jgi:multiple sugar transport system permease protein
MSRRETRAAYGFLSPWIIGFLVFTAGPICATLALSLTDYDSLSGKGSWVGLQNYKDAINDPDAANALGNTAFYAILYVPLSVAIGLGLAMLLQRAGRATGLFRTLFYLPVVTPPVATGVMFLLILNGSNGLLNDVLGWLHLPQQDWTTDPAWLKPGIVIMTLWSVGSVTIILLAALTEVPQVLIEAARVDGASPSRQFWHVTLPMISPALLFAVIVNTIAAMQLFGEVYTMYFGATTTNPPDQAVFYVIYIFEQAFRFFHMGYASALAWLLFLVIMAITAIQLRVSRSFVHYRGEA